MLDVCPAYTDKSTWTTTLLADSGISDRLVKLRSLIDHTCFEFIDVSYLGAANSPAEHSRCCILLNKSHFGLLYAD